MKRIIAVGASTFCAEDKSPLLELERRGYEARLNPFGRKLSEGEIVAHLEGAVGLIAGLEPLNRRVLEAAKRSGLRALTRVGIGMENVDQLAASELAIRVGNTPDAPTEAVAELTVTALLALARQLVPMNAGMQSGGWDKKLGMSLRGKKVFFVGFGRIARKTAEMLAPFGVEPLAYDPFLPEGAAKGAAARFVSLEDGLRGADVVSLHASGKTAILARAELALLRPGVILLNSARGELVEEEALLDFLAEGKHGGVWLDAFWEEPYKGRMREFPHVLMTPHVGTYTRECRSAMEMAAVQKLLADLG